MGCQMKSKNSFWRHQGSFHRRDDKLVKNEWNHHSRKKRKDVSEKGTTCANRGKCKSQQQPWVINGSDVPEAGSGCYIICYMSGPPSPPEYMEYWEGSLGSYHKGTRTGNCNLVPESNNEPWCFSLLNYNFCRVKCTNIKYSAQSFPVLVYSWNHFPDQHLEHGQLLSPLLDNLQKGSYYSDFYCPGLFCLFLATITLLCLTFPVSDFFFYIDGVFVCSYGSFYFTTVLFSEYHNSFIFPLLMDIWVE